MKQNSPSITHQLKSNGYSYDANLIQQIKYKLMNTATEKYADSEFINKFTGYILKHLYNRDISDQEEERIKQLNMPLLYFVFITKSYIYPNFNTSNIDNNFYLKDIKEIFYKLIPTYHHKYEEHYFDIYRYLVIYDLILNNKFFVYN